MSINTKFCVSLEKIFYKNTIISTEDLTIHKRHIWNRYDYLFTSITLIIIFYLITLFFICYTIQSNLKNSNSLTAQFPFLSFYNIVKARFSYVSNREITPKLILCICIHSCFTQMVQSCTNISLINLRTLLTLSNKETKIKIREVKNRKRILHKMINF